MKKLIVMIAVALLLGVTPLRISAQTVQTTASPFSPALSKACWPTTMLQGKDTVWKYVPCRSLDVLEPEFRYKLECMIARQNAGKWGPLVQETVRSNFLQMEYYKRGRSSPGQKVTQAMNVFKTVHGYGMAADVISAKHGWTSKRFFEWQAIHARACGLTTGADWSFKDYPHVQTGKWKGAPPVWAQELLRQDSLPVVWARMHQ